MANRNTDYLPVAEAAKVFNVETSYIQELINAKAIRGKKKDDNQFVNVAQLNEYLKKKAELEDARKPNRIQEMEEKVNQTNSLVRTIGLLFSDAIDSIAELGSLIPIIELLVTAVAFYGAGLSEVYGFEVMLGLILAQFSALFLTAHYRNTAMHWIGDFAIYASIGLGAVNTFIAVFLVLTNGSGNTVPFFVWVIPAVSAGLAVLWVYLAKMFTHERVSSRSKLKHEAKMARLEFDRQAKTDLERNNILDRMELAKLGMDEDALKTIVSTPFVQQIRVGAMLEQVIEEMLASSGISPASARGKAYLKMAEDGVAELYGNEEESDPFEDAVNDPDFLADHQNQPTPTVNGNGHHS